MSTVTITQRRCRRCMKVHTGVLADNATIRQQNIHQLCAKCTTWQLSNPNKKIK